MAEIYLNDLLRFDPKDFGKIKIKFNQWNGSEDPMELYRADADIVNTRWLFWRKKRRYFYEGQIALCLLKLSEDSWLLTTIKKVTKELGVYDGINYEGTELEEYKAYYGRVILRFHKTFMSQGRYYGEICDALAVEQILPTVYEGDDFPGYDKVRISFRSLETILSRGKRDWIAALENQKAVYLITDRANGKLYVGSATAKEGMLLQRWRSYAADGHGGNKRLEALRKEKGFDYIKENFQYSILENYNAKVEDAVIEERERWWKETLQSKAFGYNGN